MPIVTYSATPIPIVQKAENYPYAAKGLSALGASTAPLQKTYIFAGSLVASFSSEAPEKAQYYAQDHLGSNRKVVGSALEEQTNEFYAFGEGAKATGSGNDYKYTGKEFDDESGLYYYGARYYDPDLGRFVSADALQGNLGDPLSLNRYVYVKNNPLRYIDLTGNEGTERALILEITEAVDKLTRNSCGAGTCATAAASLSKKLTRIGIKNQIVAVWGKAKNGEILGHVAVEIATSEGNTMISSWGRAYENWDTYEDALRKSFSAEGVELGERVSTLAFDDVNEFGKWMREADQVGGPDKFTKISFGWPRPAGIYRTISKIGDALSPAAGMGPLEMYDAKTAFEDPNKAVSEIEKDVKDQSLLYRVGYVISNYWKIAGAVGGQVMGSPGGGS
ncbi:RHS repeat-associated core domain-containing protein [Candidatus Micrarchaeota archaeon]|nr:RHS repeat-associated core domain-containing protein [Candidatus Micrarchaeota archaeon]